MARSNLNPKDLVLSFTDISDGQPTEYSLRFGDIDNYVNGAVRKAVVYGVAIGTCCVLSLGLWRVMERKRTVIFILNQLTLVVMIIRSALFLGYSIGELSQVSYVFTGVLYPHSFRPFNVSIAANVFQVILIGLIESSMCYQLFMIFRTPKVRYWGYGLTGAFSLLGLVTVALYLYSVTRISMGYGDLFRTGVNHQANGSWVGDIPVIMFSISINLMCFILVGKLILAIKRRRYLGLRQFDSFHVLAIMFGQTLFIPSILVWVNFGYSSQETNLLSTISILMVVLTLPLSSMWASSTSSNTNHSNFVRNNSTDSSISAGSEGFEYAYKLSKVDKLNSANTDLEKETLRDSPLTSSKVAFDLSSINSNRSIPDNTFLAIAKGLPCIPREKDYRSSLETIPNGHN